MSHLSACEWNILTFIQSYKASHQCSPTLCEIAKGVGLHPSKTYRLLRQMEGAELLTMRTPGKRRARTVALISQTIGFAP